VHYNCCTRFFAMSGKRRVYVQPTDSIPTGSNSSAYGQPIPGGNPFQPPSMGPIPQQPTMQQVPYQQTPTMMNPMQPGTSQPPYDPSMASRIDSTSNMPYNTMGMPPNTLTTPSPPMQAM